MKLFARLAVGAMMIVALCTATASAAPATITCAAHAQKPYQLPVTPPEVDFVGTFTCSGNASVIHVTVFGYRDGANLGNEYITCYSTTACLADFQAPKAWGCHNYQAYAIGDANNGAEQDSEWSSIWTGCR